VQPDGFGETSASGCINGPCNPVGNEDCGYGHRGRCDECDKRRAVYYYSSHFD